MVLLGFQTLFVFCMCYAVVSDFRELLIPNWIIVTLVAAFPFFAMLYLRPETALWHILTALVVLAFTTVFFTANWIGGGDAKLMAGAALWAGPQHIAIFLLMMSALGFLLAIVLLSLRTHGSLIAGILPDNWLLRRLQVLAQEGQCPYGVAIGAAAVVGVHGIFMQ
jgi:prepilin peptidase CpaA